MSKRSKVILAVVVGLAVLALAGWRWQAQSATKDQFKLETAKVDKGRLIAKVTATGTLSALVTVQVGSQVSGRVAELRADFNSEVKRGQLIAKIDPALFQAAVDQARANLQAAQGNVAKARAQAVDARRQSDRNKALLEKKLIAQADYDTALSNADAAEAGVLAALGAEAQARASLTQASVNLAYTDILSPTSGTVISRNVDVGQTVAASLQAPTIFVIAEDLKKMQVDTSVAEADVGRLASGMDATFTVDAYPTEVFRGKVRQIRNSPQTVQNVVTYDAVVDVENPELKLKPGMTANVTFIYAEKDDVVRLPNAALRFKPPPGLLADAGARNGGSAGGAGANGTAGGATGGGATDAGRPPGAGGGARPQGAGAGGQGAARGAETRDRRTIYLPAGLKATALRVRIGISDGTYTELVEGDLQPGAEVVTDASGGPPSGMAAAMRRGL